MVKKKGKSKRTTLKDKYKIQRRIVETHRKRKKQAKRDAASGVVVRQHDKKKKKDPGIPNSWPFKQDLLKDIQRARERQQQQQHETKEKRKLELNALRQHQADGGTARTVQELMEQASRDQGTFLAKQGGSDEEPGGTTRKSDGQVVVVAGAGQQSRRAYLRELKKVVDTADVVLQVLDARDPTGSRMNAAIENAAILSKPDKRMVLVLNKIDLVPKATVGAWLTALRRSHPTVAIKASSSSDHCSKSSISSNDNAMTATVPVGMDGLLQLLKNYARTGGSTGGKSSKTTIVVGVIGYPNVGKSSIINALKRSRAVGVSPRPGFTTSLQEVVLDRNVRLLDSPGVVFDDRSAMLGNCIDAESIDDPIPPVAALLKRCDHSSLLMTYNIPSFPPNDVMMFLALVARSYGRVLKGGIPDKTMAARAVLRDWNTGKIPYFTPPPVQTGRPTVVNDDAVVVSSFGKEFDLSKFDEAVMSSLKDDTDELDFVKLDDNEVEMMDEDSAQKAVDFFAGSDDDDDDDDEMEEDDSDEEGVASTRAKLANAEDYDFDSM